MRKLWIYAAGLALLCLPGTGFAACEGRDLMEVLPPAEMAELQDRALASPFAEGNLWRATRGDQVINLAGTYHLPDPRHDSLLHRLRPMLPGTKVLLVEASPEEEKKVQQEMLKRPEFLFLTEGPTLKEMLTGPEWEELALEAKARGIPAIMAAKFRPWYMALMLGMPPCAASELKNGGRGLDHQLMALAEAEMIPLRALEPYDTLFSIFSELTLEDELDMIRAALLMAERPEDMTVTLANAYFAGKSRLLWEFTLQQSENIPGMDPEDTARQFRVMNDVLMVRRNARWLPVLLEAARSGPVLAAFGALHLSGEEGVLRLLQKEGFEIKRLDG